MKRWCLWIDVEGFSSMPLNRGAILLRELAYDLFRIGSGYIEEGCLFVHQFGDGFIITPYGLESVLDRAVPMAVALMRSAATRGGYMRAAISAGEMADVVGWHHKELRDLRENGRLVFGTGPGVMTINPVLGEGLINAHRLSGKKPRGPQLLVDCEVDPVKADPQVPIIDQSEHHVAIDWIRSGLPQAEAFVQLLLGRQPTTNELCARLALYISQETTLNPEWKDGARLLLGTAA